MSIASYRARNALTWVFIQSEIHTRAWLNEVHLRFGDGDIDSDTIRRREVKEFSGLTRGSRSNQCADIDIARRDHAAEGGIDLFEGL